MSNKNMTLTEIEKSSKQFKDTHTVSVDGFGKTKQAPEWFARFATEVMTRFDKQEQFNQFVLDQFKKHGWIK